MKIRTFFASWLAYFVAISGLFWYGFVSGFLQNALIMDKSHLVLFILVFYGLIEAAIGVRFWKTSKELDELKKVEADPESQPDSNSYIGRHIHRLAQKWQPGQRIDQTILLGALNKDIVSKNSLPKFGMEALLFSGVIGTIYGLYLALVTFKGLTMEQIVEKLSEVFSVVGIAFLPSLIAAVLTLFLHINRWNLNRGSTDLVVGIANVSEAHIIPTLERKNVLG